MELAFSTGIPLCAPSHSSFVARGVCSRTVSLSKHDRLHKRTIRMVNAVPDPLSVVPEADEPVETSELPLLSDDAVSVIDIENDEDEEFDEEDIIPLDPVASFVNAQAIKEAREKFRLHEKDSGSPEYQVATLTTKIAYLTKHLKENRKDYSSTRGLLKMVSNRRRLLKYVKRQDPERFNRLVKELNIRVSQGLRSV